MEIIYDKLTELENLVLNCYYCNKTKPLSQEITSKLLNYSYLDWKLITDYSFESGKLGFGWLLSLLKRNMQISKDVNYILFSLDDQIYKYIMQQHNLDNSFNKGLCGLILYFFERIRSTDIINKNLYRDIANRECLVYLIINLCKRIRGIINNPQSNKTASDKNFMCAFYILCLIEKTNLNKKILANILYEIKIHLLDIEEIYFQSETKTMLNLIGEATKDEDLLKKCGSMKAIKTSTYIIDMKSEMLPLQIYKLD